MREFNVKPVLEKLTRELKEFSIQEGVDKIGVTCVDNLRESRAAEGWRPQDILPGAKSIVVLGFAGIDTPRLDKIVDGYALGTPEHSINFVLLGSGWPGATLCDLVAYKIARFLTKRGYNALPIPSGHPYDKKNLRGIISHKHAAVEAGLGEIGLSTLLLTPEFGPNFYMASVLTDAPLKPDTRFEETLCEKHREKCRFACLSLCPVGALTEDGKIDKAKCGEYQYSESPHYSYPTAHDMPHQHILRCGICLRACPIGRRV